MIKIAISPCPNDIFNFYSLLKKKKFLSFPYSVETKPLHELNQLAFSSDYHFLKTSFLTYFFHEESYRLCDLGHSITHKTGPVIFSKKKYKIDDLKNLIIGTPGEGTVANFLVKSLFGAQTVYLPFYDIIKNLQESRIEAGAIIHEARTESEKYGLYKICDLTQIWYERFGTPTFLGALLARKNLDSEIYQEFMEALAESRDYSEKNKEEVFAYAQKYSQEKSLGAIAQHIQNFSINTNLSDFSLEQTVERFRQAYSELKVYKGAKGLRQ